MKAKCWKCGKENTEKPDGYYWCPFCSLWYLPLKQEKQAFLDDEESDETK